MDGNRIVRSLAAPRGWKQAMNFVVVPADPASATAPQLVGSAAGQGTRYTMRRRDGGKVQLSTPGRSTEELPLESTLPLDGGRYDLRVIESRGGYAPGPPKPGPQGMEQMFASVGNSAPRPPGSPGAPFGGDPYGGGRSQQPPDAGVPAGGSGPDSANPSWMGGGAYSANPSAGAGADPGPYSANPSGPRQAPPPPPAGPPTPDSPKNPYA
jgi:hypothetical protein